MFRPIRKTKRPATLGEISRVLGIPRGTLYIKARAKEVPGLRFRGGRYEMARATLERLVREREPAPAA